MPQNTSWSTAPVPYGKQKLCNENKFIFLALKQGQNSNLAIVLLIFFMHYMHAYVVLFLHALDVSKCC